MASYELRDAEPRDLEAIVGLIAELARFEKLEHLLEVSPQALATHLFGARPVAEAWVADANGQVVAFALAFTSFSTFLGRPGLWLEDLYVEPEWRGRGIGKSLLRHLAALALRRGYGRFEWSVLDWNLHAIRFYRALGATVMPDWRICRVTGLALHALAQSEIRRASPTSPPGPSADKVPGRAPDP